MCEADQAEIARLRRKWERERRARLQAEELAERFTRDALHDQLTGLANRALFQDRVEQALSVSRRQPRPVGILLLDLDGFKTINDSLGHNAGDQLLIGVAQRLLGSLRSVDTAARLSGDEFAVLLDNSDTGTATKVAGRIIATLTSPFHVGDRQVTVAGSIGVAVSHAGKENAEELLRGADAAMYFAKGRGKAGWAVFDPAFHVAALERLELKTDLERALENQEFIVHYQPVIDLLSGCPIGMEALVRWAHPTRGLVPPGSFVPLAEETGLVVPIGWWVLQEACRQTAVWQKQYAWAAELRICVNLAMNQLHEPEVVEEVARALEASGLAPSALVLELTESGLMRDPEWTIARLEDLKRLGIRLAVDDFGTGYSSLTYLQRFPIDIIKVDKTFVDGVDGQAEEAALAHAITKLGAALRLQVVAEGVERLQQVVELRALGCRFGQGYYFAKPLDAEGMERLLAKGKVSMPGHAA
ncbi:MAG: putative bifunctional diguanylate cyclase/phosphodiesterase [Actinomycetota bacterium]